MAAKKVFMLRLNPEIYEAMEKWAADEFRSVNGQIEWLLDAQLKKNKRSPSSKKKSSGISRT